MSQTRMTHYEWYAEGRRLFGEDVMQWAFACPACGHVARTQDWKEAGAPESAVAYSCIGRWVGAKRGALGGGEGPCNYAGGGLIGLNPIQANALRPSTFAAPELAAPPVSPTTATLAVQALNAAWQQPVYPQVQENHQAQALVQAQTKTSSGERP